MAEKMIKNVIETQAPDISRFFCIRSLSQLLDLFSDSDGNTKQREMEDGDGIKKIISRKYYTTIYQNLGKI